MENNINNGSSLSEEVIREIESVSYVVVRDGCRVSDREYLQPNDPEAIIEAEFWRRIANKHSYGEPVKIVRYDVKQHRIW